MHQEQYTVFSEFLINSKIILLALTLGLVFQWYPVLSFAAPEHGERSHSASPPVLHAYVIAAISDDFYDPIFQSHAQIILALAEIPNQELYHLLRERETFEWVRRQAQVTMANPSISQVMENPIFTEFRSMAVAPNAIPWGEVKLGRFYLLSIGDRDVRQNLGLAGSFGVGIVRYSATRSDAGAFSGRQKIAIMGSAIWPRPILNILSMIDRETGFHGFAVNAQNANEEHYRAYAVTGTGGPLFDELVNSATTDFGGPQCTLTAEQQSILWRYITRYLSLACQEIPTPPRIDFDRSDG